MQTDCIQDLLGFVPVEGRPVMAAFDGGSITSDARAMLLGATGRAIGLIKRFAACFRDARRELIEREVETLIGQRVTMRANQLRLWFCLLRLRPLLRPAPHRPKEHAVRQRQLRNHPAQATQDRRARASLSPQHQARLPQPARIQDRARPARRGGALTNQTAHSPHSRPERRAGKRRPLRTRNSRQNPFCPSRPHRALSRSWFDGATATAYSGAAAVQDNSVGLSALPRLA